jgi:hypothetical protein
MIYNEIRQEDISKDKSLIASFNRSYPKRNWSKSKEIHLSLFIDDTSGDIGCFIKEFPEISYFGKNANDAVDGIKNVILDMPEYFGL